MSVTSGQTAVPNATSPASSTAAQNAVDAHEIATMKWLGQMTWGSPKPEPSSSPSVPNTPPPSHWPADGHASASTPRPTALAGSGCQPAPS